MRPNGVYSASFNLLNKDFLDAGGVMQIRFFSSSPPADPTRAELVRLWFGPFPENGETEAGLDGDPYDGNLQMHCGIARTFISQGGTSVPIVKLQGAGDATSAATVFKGTGNNPNLSTSDPIFNMSFNSRNQWLFQPTPDERDRTSISALDSNLNAGWHIFLENFSGNTGTEFRKGLTVTCGAVWNEYK